MRRTFLFWINWGFLMLVLLFVCVPVSLDAQDQAAKKQRQVLRIPRVSRPPTLSDFLNGVPREAEATVTDFRQYRPGDGQPISQPTTAFLSYDDKNLYVAFVCKDDPKLIRARFATRDDLVSDDRTIVTLDTFLDYRRHYWFNVNPYGIQEDGVSVSGEGAYSNWDTLWYSDAKLTEDGYVTLTTIPFKSIRFPDSPEQTWGLVIGRFITRNNEWSTWPHVSSRLPSYDEQAAHLVGLENISPGRNIQLIPYGLFSRARFLDRPPEGPTQFLTENDGRAGLDAKVVLKDALTLDLALNPDFSQVESDDPQVTTNQRYEVIYPEKRPFFLDNANYFATPEQLFFSRRIADPLFGARLTGRIGDWTIGALFADDRAPGERIAPTDPWYNREAPVGVVRVQREFQRRSRIYNVAAMATSQDFASTHNRVFSLDTRLQLLSNWYLRGQAMSSDTRQADGRRLNGPAYIAEWSHAGRHFVSTTRYTDRSPNFRAQLGYFNRVDIREASHTTGYNWRPVGRAVQSFGPQWTGSINYDHQGRLQDWSIRPEFSVAMTRTTSLSAWYEKIYELYIGEGFRRHNIGVSFSTDWWRWLSPSATFSNGTGINYRPGQDLAPFLGRSREGSLGVTLRPGPHWRIQKTYIYSGLWTYGGSGLAGVESGTAVFNNHILRSNVKYQFNQHLSLRAITDYNAVLANSTLLQAPKTKHIGADILFTYLLHPGTALYVGYTDLYDNLRLNPTMNPSLQYTSSPDLNTGRQVFVKLSYLFRF